MLKINEIAPSFKANTTNGEIEFHEWMGDSWLCPCSMDNLKSYNWAMVLSAVEEKVAARLPLIAATKPRRAQSGRLPRKHF